MSRPPIALTCGDPAGIGPELAAKTWAALGREMDIVWFGDPHHLPSDTPWVAYDAKAPHDPERLAVYPIEFATAPVAGQPDGRNAQGIVAAIETAARMAIAGEMAAVCTLPIAKHVLQTGADFAFPGHTEFLADIDGTDRFAMMLTCPELSVVPLTIHIPISEVPQAVTPQLISDTVQVIDAAFTRYFDTPKPRISVAGLNPHAGENGKIGLEDRDVIGPTLDGLRAQGYNVTAPASADTMFHAQARAGYDVALCMYHDQALIPIKTIDFSGGVNVTLGLSFIRTSPDHGTAFDIAGQDRADPTSTLAAMRLAHKMAQAHNAN